jgi:CheY-like chemotaxis protein
MRANPERSSGFRSRWTRPSSTFLSPLGLNAVFRFRSVRPDIETPFMSGSAVILVVEDEALVRALAVDILEEAGFEVIEAPSADYAVLVLEQRSDVRVVFTDVEMPGRLNGFQLARIIQDYYHRTGVVVGSGRVQPTSGELSPKAIFLAKPYRASALVEAVRKLAA